jgi:hypothetical protein
MSSHVFECWQVPEGSDPCPPPTTRAPSFARSWWCLKMNHHASVHKFQGGAAEPRQHQPCPATCRRAAPRSTSLRSRPSPRVRGSRATNVQRPPGQPGCCHGTPSAGQAYTRGRSSHGLSSGRHGPGRGKEHNNQICCIVFKSSLMQPI